MASGANRRGRTDGRRLPRGGLVTLLLVLGTAAAVGGSFALWLDRQALSPSGWQTTSSQLIANPQIRRGVGTFAVSELFAQTNVAGALRSALGPAAARPALRTLRSLGLHLAAGILATRSARVAWNKANRVAHRELLAILDHGGQRGEVTLNLTPLLAQLIRALQASAPVKAIPGGGQLFTVGSPRAGEVPILSASQIAHARAVANAIRGLSVGLLVAAAMLFAVAVAIARGWRSIAVRRVGYCLIVVGTVVLVARALLAPALAEALVSGSTYRTAAHAAWTIATTELRDAAIVVLVCGAVLVLAGLATGGLVPRRGRPA
ncbi:MAG TPA: hypothetical protein VHW04_25200 [Solirubrobacteraceae bacterium]|nr:hypothetical protein [Solirubrobacteraceae bacterium]